MALCTVRELPGAAHTSHEADEVKSFDSNPMVLVQAAAGAVRAGIAAGGGAALPGMIFNGKKQVSYLDAASGEQHSVRAGRLECTMQVRGCGALSIH